MSQKSSHEELKEMFKDIETNNDNQHLIDLICEICSLLHHHAPFEHKYISKKSVMEYLTIFGKLLDQNEFYYKKSENKQAKLIGKEALNKLRNDDKSYKLRDEVGNESRGDKVLH